MADVNTAGTFIAAALEQAGYIAQSRFLVDFRDFFREAGALVYILGAIGGIVSVVVFGSFRAARYLVLGPALYWFLVGPTSPSEGVIWKIGAGASRGMNQQRGDGPAKEYVQRALKQAGLQGDEQIEVATGFLFFTKLIGSITNGLADVILENEDGDYLMHISKGRALDVLLSVQVEDPNFIQMMEGDFVNDCTDMFGYAVARAGFDKRGEVFQAMGQAGQSAASRSEYYETQFKKYNEKTRFNPNGSTRAFIRAQTGQQEVPDAISCNDMWKLIAQYLQDQAKMIAPKVLEVAKGDNGDADQACRNLMEKIQDGAGNGGACNLENVVALYLLKNAVFDRRSLGRFVKRLTDTMGDPKGIEDQALIPLSGKQTPEILAEGNAIVNMVDNNMAGMINMTQREEQLYYVAKAQQLASLPEHLNNMQMQRKIRDTFQAAARMSAIGGPLDAGFTEYPRYHLRALRQGLFTFAMNLPYWQGVILYLLAIAYPFMALLVLLPGRATGFLLLPLAWLWIKSWDLGFAFVMVFEKVLWNVLPSLMVPPNITQAALAERPLWELLSESMKFDHTWNLHMYYVCLSMVTLAIPGVTGYATMKARSSVLSSFTNRLAADAKDAGTLAAGAHGVGVMADRVAVINQIKGMAFRAMSQKGGGAGAEGRLQRAEMWGQMAFAAKLAEKAPGMLTGDLKPGSAISVPGEALAEYTRVKAEMLNAETKAAQEYAATFHPLFGRNGKLAQMNEAYAAAMDGSGGFELNATETSPIDAYIALHNKRVDKLYQYAAAFGTVDMVAQAGSALGADIRPMRDGILDGLTRDPTRLPEALETMKKFGIPQLINETHHQLVENPANKAENEKFQKAMKDLTGALPPEIRFIGNPAMMTQVEWSERGVMNEALGLTAGSVREIRKHQAALADPVNGPEEIEKFQKRFMYDPSEMFEGLPRHMQEALRKSTVDYSRPFTGEDGGKPILDQYDKTWYGPDRMEEMRQKNPGIFEANPAETGAGFGDFGAVQRVSGPVADAAQVAFNAVYEISGEGARDRRDANNPFKNLNMMRDADSETTYGTEKQRLAALNMDWLFGDDEERELAEQKHRRKPLANPIKSNRKGIA